MTIFEIRDESEKDRLLGYLFYYPKRKRFYTELLSSLDEWNAPFIFWGQVKKGEYSIGHEKSLEFVRQRIIPYDRQNIGMILRDNNMSEYDEYRLLLLSQGKCAQDEIYLVKVDEEDIVDEIKDRLSLKIKDVMPLNRNRVMAFFKNNRTGIADIEKLRKEDRMFSRILNDKDLFGNVKISPGGNGIEWGSSVSISAEELYEKCEDIDIIYEDIVGFLINRVVDTSEVSQLIGCSRQYINQLVNQGKIKPIKEGANNNLFMRSDIEEELA